MGILLENWIQVSLFVFWQFVPARGISKRWRGLTQGETSPTPSLFSGVQRFWRSLLPSHKTPLETLCKNFYGSSLLLTRSYALDVQPGLYSGIFSSVLNKGERVMASSLPKSLRISSKSVFEKPSPLSRTARSLSIKNSVGTNFTL